MSSAPARVQTDPRISRRRRAIERARRKRFFVRASVALAVVAAVWAALWSPLLQVRDVRVVGARHTSAEEVTRATGIDSDTNVLLVSTEDIASRVQGLPWVRAAEVDRMLPGTIRVRVVERKPALILSLVASRYTIDSQGLVLQAGEAVEGLPVLAGVAVGSVDPGDRLRTSEARSALRAYRTLPAKLRKDVAAVFAPTIERITFSLDDGTQLRYGAAERMRAKNEVIGVLLRRLAAQGRRATYIDVRVPSSPAVAAATAAALPSPAPGTPTPLAVP